LLIKQTTIRSQCASKNSILEIRQTIEHQLKAIRDDNNLQLNEMRQTVDEKLHDTWKNVLANRLNKLVTGWNKSIKD